MTSIIVFDDLVAGLGTCPSDPDVAGTGVYYLVIHYNSSYLLTEPGSIIIRYQQPDHDGLLYLHRHPRWKGSR